VHQAEVDGFAVMRDVGDLVPAPPTLMVGEVLKLLALPGAKKVSPRVGRVWAKLHGRMPASAKAISAMVRFMVFSSSSVLYA
jgi:hypothetical protein